MTFVGDRETTSARISLLREYFDREVLGTDEVICSSLGECRRSAQFDQAGFRRRGVEFAAGQLPHVGSVYDLAENGRPLRVLVIAMETGRGHERVTLDQRRAQLGESMNLTMTKRNPHMQGVTSALRLVFGREPGADRVGELLELEGGDAAHLFDAYAMTNIRLCSAYANGSTDSRATAVMSRNCMRHLAATVEILEPTLCIVQGTGLPDHLAAVITRRAVLRSDLERVDLAGVETLLATFSHPTARAVLRWGGLTGTPYLYDTVMPTLKAARELLIEPDQPAPAPSAPTTTAPRPAGVRLGFALPRRAAQPTDAVARPTARSSLQVAADARSHVVREIELRGGSARESHVGSNRWVVRMSSPSGTRELRVRGKTSGDWQGSIRDGDGGEVSDDRFWVFVDLKYGPPRCYIAPDSWVVADIRADFARYLALHGGHRPVTEGSTHHKVEVARIEQWRERWDLIGLPWARREGTR